MRFIGIHGPAGSGKSTLAAFVCRALAQRGWNPVRRSFADPIRAVAEALTGISMVQFRDVETKAGMSPYSLPSGERLSNRRLLQVIGSMLRQTLAHGVLRAVELRLPSLFADERTVVVFDDLRMPAERYWLQDRNAKLIWIVGRSGVLTPVEKADATELQLPARGFQWVVDNTGTAEDLERAANTWVADTWPEIAPANEIPRVKQLREELTRMNAEAL